MKYKWIIPVVLFAVLVVGYVARSFFQTRITLEMLQKDKIEESSSGLGVLIKTESVNSVSVSGAAEVAVQNGQRVANGELLATVYSGTSEEGVMTQLAEVNKRINAMKDSNAGDSVFINDATKIESEIEEIVGDVIQQASRQDMEMISEYKYRISTLSDQKAVAQGEKTDFSNNLTELQSEKSVLESKLGKIESVVVAQTPGIFIEGSDGFESSLTPDMVTTLTPNTVDEVINKDKNREIAVQDGSTYTYKIVDNYAYYVAINIDDALSSQVKAGDSVTVRFSDITADDCPAEVVYVSDKNEKNLRTVVVKCSMYVEGLLSKRVVNVDFVKKSVSGYKVQIEYLHTVDNAVGLFIKRGAVMKFIPVDIVYSTEDEAIVEAADSTQPIKPYDEVVTSAPEFYDGKVIVSQ